MRGIDDHQPALFSYLSPEERIPQDHPLRRIRHLTEAAFRNMSHAFDALYSDLGRPSIPPEHLLRALLLQVLYTIRSERLLMEQLDYNLLFRWFVGLTMDDAVWDATVFSKNRDRLLEGHIADEFFAEILSIARTQELLSDEHFTVDGTLIEAWAGAKSFRKNSDVSAPTPASEDSSNPSVNFRGDKRTNATHRSTTDPQARLYRKGPGKEAKLSYMGHVLMDNRHGIASAGMISLAKGTAERASALDLLAGHPQCTRHRLTIGGDKGYDTKNFVEGVRILNATPHVAQNTTNRSSAIDGRTTHHAGYGISQGKRKLVEQIFGWIKTVGLMRKTRHRGKKRVGWMFTFSLGVYNLVRINNLVSEARSLC